VIQTVLHRIEGSVHVRLDGRVKDELDRDEPFLAVTNAKVFGLDGALIYQADFMSVSRAQIVWVIPSDDANATGEPK
jgi:hypothetical protein